MPPRPPLQPGRPRSPLAARGVRDGGRTLTPGTSVRVGGIDQTPYLRYGSMTMRLNSFDFGLVAPATKPAVGDLVFVLEPAWQGQVVSIEQATESESQGVFYSVTASNAAQAYASPAPFGMSDTPDNATTYGYQGLRLGSTMVKDGTTETRGSFTTFHGGLWPGMTFTLTNALFGLSAAQYTVANLTITWLTNNQASYAIEFGDAMVPLSVWANQSTDGSGQIDGTRITDGSITTPKLAANVVITELLVDQDLQFTGGTYFRGGATVGLVTVDRNGVSGPCGFNIVNTAQASFLTMQRSGEASYRVNINSTNGGGGSGGIVAVGDGSGDGVQMEWLSTGTMGLTGINGITLTGQLNTTRDGQTNKIKAGVVDDTDFTNDVDGNWAFDSTDHRLYYREGGGWHYIARTAGFQVPADETACPDCGRPMEVGQAVRGRIESTMDDGALHGLWVHAECPTGQATAGATIE